MASQRLAKRVIKPDDIKVGDWLIIFTTRQQVTVTEQGTQQIMEPLRNIPLHVIKVNLPFLMVDALAMPAYVWQRVVIDVNNRQFYCVMPSFMSSMNKWIFEGQQRAEAQQATAMFGGQRGETDNA